MSHPYLKYIKGLQDLAPPYSPSLIFQHFLTFLTLILTLCPVTNAGSP